MTTHYLSRDVILDLVAVYLAGDASPDTRAIVDAEMARDPALAAHVRAALADSFGGLRAPSPAADAEVRTITRTRRRLAAQRWVFGLASAFTAVALSLRISSEGVRLALIGHPVAMALTLGPAVTLWTVYFAMRSRR